MYIDKNLITLVISHNIYLTKEERYALQNQETEINTIGISVPVWFYQGKTSEPATEVFCKYKLKISNINQAITKYNEGYVIYIPNYLEDQKVSVASMLLDCKDGGKESVLYKEFGKFRSKSTNYNTIHIVEIHDYNKLIDTII